jgi:inner membrane protein
MQKALLIKAALVAALFLLLQIPLNMIDGLVAERQGRQEAVVKEISTGNYGKQVFAGPILSIPYVEEYEQTHTSDKEKKTETIRNKGVVRFFPESEDIDGKAAIGTKYRGLFKVRVFNWQAKAKGVFHFDGKFAPDRVRANSRIAWGRPTLTLLLSDPRGLIGSPALEWKGLRVDLERGSALGNSSGLHAFLPVVDPTKSQRLEYSLDIGLLGTESLSIAPIAGNETVRLASDWPHPSFGGQFLPRPESQRRSSSGFEGRWTVSALASGAQQQLRSLIEAGRDCDAPCMDAFSVQFIEPVAIYTLSDRALKYGFLFVGITFGCFFLFEILKALPIHPAQYLLVGLALATFFLLLLGLSEHMDFWIAYAVAAASCILLQGFYLSAVLKSKWRGASFSMLLTVLYGALYGLLISEDNALLLGSILVFVLVAAAMAITRKLDWYSVGRASPQPA